MSTIAKWIYCFFIWLDKKLGCYDRYKGETAPYCGHAYDGHMGAFTKSHFHESDGGGETHGWFSRWILGVWYSNVDGQEYGFHFPLYMWCRWVYYELKRSFKLFSIKVDYPHGKRTLYIRVDGFRPRHKYWLGNTTLHIFRLRGILPVSHSTVDITGNKFKRA